MRRLKPNPSRRPRLAAVAVLALALGALSWAAPDADGDDTEIRRQGQIKIVVEDEDGERHEETIEFDSDKPAPWLGVRLAPTPEGGARIEEVFEGTAAETAGLRTGDVIVGWGNEEIDGPWDVTRRVLTAEPGDRVELEVLRDGVRQSFAAELGQREAGSFVFGLGHGALREQMERLHEHMGRIDPGLLHFDFELPGLGDLGWGFGPRRPRLGVELSGVTPELREHLGGPRDAGVLVARVLPGSPAEESDVRVGDLIVAVDGREVRGQGDLVRALREREGQTVELEVVRDGATVLLHATLPQPEEDRPLRRMHGPGPLPRAQLPAQRV